MSADDLSGNLHSYQVQLQQVEAALTNDPHNEELLKLRKDLQEVINLTTELISAGTSDVLSTVAVNGAPKDKDSKPVLQFQWKAGDSCMAPWSEDGMFYEAVIEDVTEDGQCTVNFLHYGNTDVSSLHLLRAVDKDLHSDLLEGSSKSKKQIVQAQREYKKKKAQKKAQKMKQIEEEREKEKGKWQSFNSKAFNKNKKGHVKKSIFASPDNVNGRVGVGTCGIGGRPMTEYHQQEKWRRPMAPPHPFE